MLNLRTWAHKHNVPFAAIFELERAMGIAPPEMAVTVRDAPIGSETRQQDLVRLEAGKFDIKLFRNNVGALKDARGIPVRYGLANDSEQLNKVLKSSDLVGWRRRLITPDMVGIVMGQVVLREMKPEGWQYCGDEHELAQLAFINLCIADGGDACFCTGPGSF